MEAFERQVTQPSQKMDSITMIACISRILLDKSIYLSWNNKNKTKQKQKQKKHYLSLKRDIYIYIERKKDHLKSSKRHRSIHKKLKDSLSLMMVIRKVTLNVSYYWRCTHHSEMAETSKSKSQVQKSRHFRASYLSGHRERKIKKSERKQEE